MPSAFVKISAQRFDARKPHRLGYAISALFTPDIAAARAPSNVPPRRPHNPQRVAEGRRPPGRTPSRSIRWRPHDPGPGRLSAALRATAAASSRCAWGRPVRRHADREKVAWRRPARGDADIELRRSDPHSVGHKPCCAEQRQRGDPEQQRRVAGRARPHYAEHGAPEQR